MGGAHCCTLREDHDGPPDGIQEPDPDAYIRPCGSCSCQAFRQNGCCAHAPKHIYGLPITPRIAKELYDVPRREVQVDAERISYYMMSEKTVVAREPGDNPRCGIFLDVDGVLHPYGAPCSELFCNMNYLVEILDAVPCCDLVLSSSWRMDAEGIQEVNDRICEARPALEPADAQVLDVTERTRGSLNYVGNRDIEIQAWIDDHADEVGWEDRWIALDDLNLTEAFGAEHCVVCDYEIGLTEEKVLEAINKLHELQGIYLREDDKPSKMHKMFAVHP